LTGGLVAQQGAVITGPAGVGRTTLAMTDAAGTHLSREEWRRVAKAFVKERARR
jgi:predicted ATP-dependent serine protease